MNMLPLELYWLIIGVLLLLLEMGLPGFVLFFFGVGALVVAAALWLLPAGSLPIVWQLGLFLAVSLLSLAALRGVVMRKFFALPAVDKKAQEEQGREDIIHAKPGEKAVVSQAIYPPAEGQLKFAGTFWRATADEPVEAGEVVAVVSQHQLVIHVKKWEA